MAIPVKLQVFEGPLDLLLHLIDKNKIDIYDIPIVQITEQYLEYIRAMQTEDMNIMSEFLVMAATLLDIKCKMLLPVEESEEGEEEDPRAELVQKLLEYKLYKYMSAELRERQSASEKQVYKPPTLPKEVLEYKTPVDYDELMGDTDLRKLNDIFQAVLKRQVDKIDPIRSKFGKIEKEEVNLEQKRDYIVTYIKNHPKCSFADLLSKQRTKMEIIVTFLVVLESIKVGAIVAKQSDDEEDILITYTGIEFYPLEDMTAVAEEDTK